MTFDQYIANHLTTPFKWRENDCMTFAVGWLSILAERDLLELGPAWSSEEEAVQVIKQVGGIERTFDKHLKRINSNFAKDGDVALIKRSVYLFSGSQIVGPGKEGLVFIDRMNAQCAWSL